VLLLAADTRQSFTTTTTTTITMTVTQPRPRGYPPHHQHQKPTAAGGAGGGDHPPSPKKQKPVLERVPEALDDGRSAFARALASVDYHTRERGVHALTLWLVRRGAAAAAAANGAPDADADDKHNDNHDSSGISDVDLLKVWKGLFFTLWHSDTPPVQRELARRLSAVQCALPPQLSRRYAAAAFATLRREWPLIDKHRVDKFLVLARELVRQALRSLAARGWPRGGCEAWARMLRDVVLLPADGGASSPYRVLAGAGLPAAPLPSAAARGYGVAYQVADVFLTELLAVGYGEAKEDDVQVIVQQKQQQKKNKKQQQQQQQAAAAAAAIPADALAALFAPFELALARAGDDPAVKRYQTAVFDALAAEVGAEAGSDLGRRVAQEAEEEKEDEEDSDDDEDDEAAHEEKEQRRAERRRACLVRAAAGSPLRLLDAKGLAQRLFELGAADTARARNRAALYGCSERLERAALRQARLREAAAEAVAAVGGGAAAGGGGGGPNGAGAAAKKAKKKRGEEEEEEQEEEHEEDAGKRQKKDQQSGGGGGGGSVSPKKQQQRHQHRHGKAEADDAPAAQEEQEEEPLSPRKRVKQQQQEKQQGAPLSPQTPAGASKPKKKRVSISLRDNVFFDFGGPVPPRDVVTPPAARPRGSALKRTTRSQAAKAAAQHHHQQSHASALAAAQHAAMAAQAAAQAAAKAAGAGGALRRRGW
jgi:ribosomal RNA-processing protein 1